METEEPSVGSIFGVTPEQLVAQITRSPEATVPASTTLEAVSVVIDTGLMLLMISLAVAYTSARKWTTTRVRGHRTISHECFRRILKEPPRW